MSIKRRACHDGSGYPLTNSLNGTEQIKTNKILSLKLLNTLAYGLLFFQYNYCDSV